MQRKHILQFICLSLWVAMSSAPKAATEEITVLLDWFINPDHAPLIVAEQEVFLKTLASQSTSLNPQIHHSLQSSRQQKSRSRD